MGESGNRYKILLISYLRGDVQLLVGQLDPRQYTVRAVSSGAAAAAYLKRQQADIAIVDMELARPRGFDLLKQVREKLPSAFLLVWADSPSSSDVEDARKAGSDACLAKPVSETALRAALEAGLRKRAMRRRLQRVQHLQNALASTERALDKTRAREREIQRRIASSRSAADLVSPKDSGEHLPVIGADSPTASHPVARAMRGPSDTQEFATADWNFFRVLEPPLSAAIEAGDVLSAMVLEASTIENQEHADSAEFLEVVRARIGASIPRSAMLRRLGGRSFCVLLPKVDEQGAEILAERIVRAVTSAPVPVGDDDVHATIVVGVAARTPTQEGSPFSLIDWTLDALTKARASGGTGVWASRRTTVVARS